MVLIVSHAIPSTDSAGANPSTLNRLIEDLLMLWLSELTSTASRLSGTLPGTLVSRRPESPNAAPSFDCGPSGDFDECTEFSRDRPERSAATFDGSMCVDTLNEPWNSFETLGDVSRSAAHTWTRQ